MNLQEAIKVFHKMWPCAHENYNTHLGDGTTWAHCEDCGETFKTENLQRYQRSSKEFEEAMKCLNLITKAVN